MKKTRENLKKEVKKITIKISTLMAEIDANTACPYWGYQEIEPKEVKKLRKF